MWNPNDPKQIFNVVAQTNDVGTLKQIAAANSQGPNGGIIAAAILNKLAAIEKEAQTPTQAPPPGGNIGMQAVDQAGQQAQAAQFMAGANQREKMANVASNPQSVQGVADAKLHPPSMTGNNHLLPEHAGIGALPEQSLSALNAASGGIVAFAGRGPSLVPGSGLDMFDQALDDEGVTDPTRRAFLKALHGQESGGASSSRTSNRGARGPMQVMPGTFAGVNKAGDLDPESDYDNMRAGIRYGLQGWDLSGGNPVHAGAFYYGGPLGLKRAQRGEFSVDPVNPKNPNTLEYGATVAKRMDKILTAAAPGREAHAATPTAAATEPGELTEAQEAHAAREAWGAGAARRGQRYRASQMTPVEVGPSGEVTSGEQYPTYPDVAGPPVYGRLDKAATTGIKQLADQQASAEAAAAQPVGAPLGYTSGEELPAGGIAQLAPDALQGPVAPSQTEQIVNRLRQDLMGSEAMRGMEDVLSQKERLLKTQQEREVAGYEEEKRRLGRRGERIDRTEKNAETMGYLTAAAAAVNGRMTFMQALTRAGMAGFGTYQQGMKGVEEARDKLDDLWSKANKGHEDSINKLEMLGIDSKTSLAQMKLQLDSHLATMRAQHELKKEEPSELAKTLAWAQKAPENQKQLDEYLRNAHPRDALAVRQAFADYQLSKKNVAALQAKYVGVVEPEELKAAKRAQDEAYRIYMATVGNAPSAGIEMPSFTPGGGLATQNGKLVYQPGQR